MYYLPTLGFIPVIYKVKVICNNVISYEIENSYRKCKEETGNSRKYHLERIFPHFIPSSELILSKI